MTQIMKTIDDLDITLKLGQAFEKVLKKNYGSKRAPTPIVTPFGIKHLDALLGGGIVSSGPVLITSTPETGKSTVAFQFSSIFQQLYSNGMVVYLDVEGAGNIGKSTQFCTSRIELFNLDNSRFKYEPIILTVTDVFELISTLIDIKKRFEEVTKKEIYVLFIWDSIPATRVSKTDTVDNVNSIIGLKARELGFNLDKYNPLLKFNKISFIGIDQVRANIKIDGPYASVEKSVGVFRNMKTASNIYSLQHNIQQWVFLSKREVITKKEQIGIDGWKMDIYTEKNKLAPSQHSVSCVFDKRHGIDKFWSEYEFLSTQTKEEKKIYGARKMPCDLMIKTSGSYVYLGVKDGNQKTFKFKSDNFYRKNAKELYNSNNEFKSWFDYAVDMSVYYRIQKGIFEITDKVENINRESTDDIDQSPVALDVSQEPIQPQEPVNNMLDPITKEGEIQEPTNDIKPSIIDIEVSPELSNNDISNIHEQNDENITNESNTYTSVFT